eukprot:comp21695_c0_seq1/m.30598 comp21695_c0_seq1/g.30598  ORF comp21695_c0_seq1/g.30598 comp21695_c0_seq1/m.30598 type:complete len:1007 (-) comp21695_c0_seq1:691-3711(-)
MQTARSSSAMQLNPPATSPNLTRDAETIEGLAVPGASASVPSSMPTSPRVPTSPRSPTTGRSQSPRKTTPLEHVMLKTMPHRGRSKSVDMRASNGETGGEGVVDTSGMPKSPGKIHKLLARFRSSPQDGGHEGDQGDTEFEQVMADALSHKVSVEDLAPYVSEYAAHASAISFINRRRGNRANSGGAHQPTAYLGVEGIFSQEHYRKRFVEIVDGTLLIWTDRDGMLKRKIILKGSKVSTPEDAKKIVIRVSSPFFGNFKFFCKDEAEQKEWVTALEHWATQDNALQQDLMLWSQAQELFDDYQEKFSGVGIHTTDHHIDYLRPHLTGFLTWVLHEADVPFTPDAQARLEDALADYRTLMRVPYTVKQNIDWVLKPIVANLVEALMPLGAAQQIEAKYTSELANSQVPSMNIVIMTVGSRGDVQPFIAFGLKLKAAGHRVRIAAHECFRDWVHSYGLDFFRIAGDPKDLMKTMTDNDLIISRAFIKNNIIDKRVWFKELLKTAWASCTEPWDGIGEETPILADGSKRPERYRADIIIANPPSFAGPHIAERLGVPLFMSFTMPWSPTREVAAPFLSDGTEGKKYLNYMSFVAVDRATWIFSADMINNWRSKVGLPSLSQLEGPSLLSDRRVPFIYCFSPSLLPKPLDWGPWIDVVGFYFLDQTSSGYTPDPDLAEFLAAGEPPIFVGFGSIVVKDPQALVNNVVQALTQVGRRAIVQQGWAELKAEGTPDFIKFIGPAPHDWLFDQCCAVVHHGGAGTTSVGLLAGKPTVIVPFFGDQFFWGQVVHAAGAGPVPVPHEKLTVKKLADAIEYALKPQVMVRAQQIGKKIAEEKGTDNAVSSVIRRLPLLAMRDSLVPTLKAEVACRDCRLRLSVQSDKVLHCSNAPERAELASHVRTHLVYTDWGRSNDSSPGGYHGRPLDESEKSFIAQCVVDPALEDEIVAAYLQLQEQDPSKRPELPDSSLAQDEGHSFLARLLPRRDIKKVPTVPSSQNFDASLANSNTNQTT